MSPGSHGLESHHDHLDTSMGTFSLLLNTIGLRNVTFKRDPIFYVLINRRAFAGKFPGLYASFDVFLGRFTLDFASRPSLLDR